MNTSPRECCEKCANGSTESGYSLAIAAPYCLGKTCPCHTSPQHTSPEKEYIAKVISEFRSKFVRDDGLMDKYYTYGMGEPGDHVAFMAEAIEDFFKEKLEECANNTLSPRK